MSIFKRKKKTDDTSDKKDQKKTDKLKDEKKDIKVKIDKITKRPDWAPDGPSLSDKQETKEPNEKIKKDVKKVKKEDLKKTHGQAYKHLIRPVITEKSAFVGMYNQYIFEVADRSNKVEIKKAIQSLYGVTPIKVNIVNMRGKNVRYGRQFGKLKNWKKAIITLRSGDKIDVYEGV